MFTKLLAGEKITLGAALVLPVVPTAVAAVGLPHSPLDCGSVSPHPAMHCDGSLRPTENGVALAKARMDAGDCGQHVIDELTSD